MKLGTARGAHAPSSSVSPSYKEVPTRDVLSPVGEPHRGRYPARGCGVGESRRGRVEPGCGRNELSTAAREGPIGEARYAVLANAPRLRKRGDALRLGERRPFGPAGRQQPVACLHRGSEGRDCLRALLKPPGAPGSGKAGTPCERIHPANLSPAASPLPVPAALGPFEGPQAAIAIAQTAAMSAPRWPWP
jgi:hypothetical protein